MMTRAFDYCTPIVRPTMTKETVKFTAKGKTVVFTVAKDNAKDKNPPKKVKFTANGKTVAFMTKGRKGAQ